MTIYNNFIINIKCEKLKSDCNCKKCILKRLITLFNSNNIGISFAYNNVNKDEKLLYDKDNDTIYNIIDTLVICPNELQRSSISETRNKDEDLPDKKNIIRVDNKIQLLEIERIIINYARSNNILPKVNMKSSRNKFIDFNMIS